MISTGNTLAFCSFSSLDFQASYKLDVPSLCIDFQEDIEFHFSLGWQAILRKFLAPHNAGLAIALGANVSIYENRRFSLKEIGRGTRFTRQKEQLEETIHHRETKRTQETKHV